VGAKHLPEQISPIEASFSCLSYKRLLFPDYTVNIKDQGAIGVAKVTREMQQSIDTTSARGSGKIIISKGMEHWPDQFEKQC